MSAACPKYRAAQITRFAGRRGKCLGAGWGRLVTHALILILLPLKATLAQNGDSFLTARESAVPFMETPFSAQVDCRDFISRTVSEYSVISAELHTGEVDVPDHCRITGVIPPEILFEVNLPLAWNGRFYMYGNGGFAGQSPESKAPDRNRGLRNGFATAYTNTGHEAQREPGASFAYNNTQKLIDYSFRAVHLTAVYAKQLINDFYKRELSYSYWDGCSKGGRQGMMSAQRFPDDFDGIVAGAPAFDFTGTMLMYYWTSHVMDGATFSMDKVELLAQQVYARCDGTDGLEDGLITDPRRCDFDPEKHLPACTGSANQENCFTQDEISRLRDIYRGPQRNGESIYPGAPPGAETRGVLIDPDEREEHMASGWVPWIINPAGPTIQELMISSYLKFLAFEKDNPDYNWRDYSIDPLPEGLDRATPQLLDVKSTDLSRFRARGGKMITYFGWADTAINPVPIVNYYESLQGAMDHDPHDFYRLFMVPGMFHCRGGAGADQMDVMTPVIEWVETGKAPVFITGKHVEGGEVKFSRPQCPYPEVASYRGSGDINASGSFECTLPR